MLPGRQCMLFPRNMRLTCNDASANSMDLHPYTYRSRRSYCNFWAFAGQYEYSLSPWPWSLANGKDKFGAGPREGNCFHDKPQHYHSYERGKQIEAERGTCRMSCKHPCHQRVGEVCKRFCRQIRWRPEIKGTPRKSCSHCFKASPAHSFASCCLLLRSSGRTRSLASTAGASPQHPITTWQHVENKLLKV